VFVMPSKGFDDTHVERVMTSATALLDRALAKRAG